MNLEEHCIRTGTDGKLDGTTTDQVKALAQRLGEQEKIVIHLHGGLVSEETAIRKAKELIPVYEGVGAYPLFFIYRTGLLEIIQNNVHEIFNERIFKKLLKKLLKYVVGKLITDGATRAAGGLQTPRDLTVSKELKKVESKVEPFGELEPVTDVDEVSDDEEKLLTDDLACDIDFQMEIQAIVDGATPDHEEEDTSRGLTVRHKVSSKTLMSVDVVEELVEDASKKDARGLFSTAKFIYRVAKIFKRVISRHIKSRDHGAYTTVVEEILRELYIANVGAAVWGMMKKETEDTFQSSSNSDDVRGGSFFVHQLGKVLAETRANPQVTIVAHSLGSVYACNLITHLAEAREDPNHPLPDSFVLENLILLAPAAEHELFSNMLTENQNLFRNFRMFALRDELERGYWEIPVIYPRSLLYFVSGVVEEREDGRSAFDRPLVGMERYFRDSSTYGEADVTSVRAFLTQKPNHCIWSIEDRDAGLASDAVRHGGFDDTVGEDGVPVPRKTMDSVLHILRQGMQ